VTVGATGMNEIEILSPVQEVAFPDEWHQLTGADHFWFQWRIAAALRLIRAAGIATDVPLRALEVGGGTGILRDQIEGHTSWVVDLTDLSVETLRLSRPGRGRRLYYDVREEQASLVGTYDVVILFDVLEHIEASRPFVGSVLRHLRPGGYLIVNVPALQSLFSTYDEAAGHVRRYDKRTLASEFEGSGLAVLDLRYWGLCLVPLLALRKLILRKHRQAATTIRTGFRPPGALAHALLRGFMRMEVALWSRPPIGTSLLLVGRNGVAAEGGGR